MKYCFKKILSSVIVSILFIFTSISSLASVQDSDTNENTIISEVINLDNSGKMQNSDLSIISSIDNYVSDVSTNNILNEENKAIRYTTTKEDGLVEVVTVVPYKRLSSGELVNSFEYASTQSSIQTRDTNTTTTDLVDGVFTIITYYTLYALELGVIKFYRHTGIEAYWNSDNSSMSVTNIFVEYISSGELHKYPECLTGDATTSLVQSYYSICSTINQNNPQKNYGYIDGAHAMPYERVLKLTNYITHDSGINLSITYSVNGINYTEEGTYPIYAW